MNKRIEELIEQLLDYALQNNLIFEEDIIFTRNSLLELFNVEKPMENTENEAEYSSNKVMAKSSSYSSPIEILNKMLDYAYENSLIEENNATHRDLFDTKIMGLITPKPSQVVARFNRLKDTKTVKHAVDDFYSFSKATNYIRCDRIAKNIKWDYHSNYGDLEVTINLTKPEKDPKEIAALKNAVKLDYPKCLLCPQNVGFAGRLNHPARQTLRTLPLTLVNKRWYFQFSPYVYYNQHCIVFNEDHTPMFIDKYTFKRLFEFLDLFPHYFIGSNADLPIVGGSILNHDHFQGGFHTMPMAKANQEIMLNCLDYSDVDACIVDWPMSVLRLSSKNKEHLIELSNALLQAWRKYSDKTVNILAKTTDDKGNTIEHNTITPISRFTENNKYQIDLVFRNNRTSDEYPLGIFHPHQELHHIKKENIGLIEVMGLFILPGRLNNELNLIKNILTGNDASQEYKNKENILNKHEKWIEDLINKHGIDNSLEQADEIIKNSVGGICETVLSHAGVFKTDKIGREAFKRFLSELRII